MLAKSATSALTNSTENTAASLAILPCAMSKLFEPLLSSRVIRYRSDWRHWAYRRQTGNYPETGSESIKGDFPEADFGTTSSESASERNRQLARDSGGIATASRIAVPS